MITENIYNPDILSCIANLSTDEVFTPPEIANDILDLLPSNIWNNPDIKLLDPSLKSGVFLREAAKRFMTGLRNDLPNTTERINHIMQNQLFGLPLTELTGLISRRTLYTSKFANHPNSLTSKFNDEFGNIPYQITQHNWQNNKCLDCGANKKVFQRDQELENYAYPFLHAEEVFKNMKFDVILGNPPYHISDSGQSTGSSPIYHLFVNKAVEMQPEFICMVIPSRWFAGGKGLDNFRNQMLSDKRISKLVDFPIASDVFPGLKVIGGVCYFLWEKSYKGECEVTTKLMGNSDTLKRSLNQFDTFVRFNRAIPILEKIKNANYPSLSDSISSQKPFGLRTFVKPSGKGDVTLYANKAKGMIERSEIQKNRALIDFWNVFISMGYGEGGEKSEYPRKIIGQPIVARPPNACTETYLIVNSFSNEKGAKNLASFLKTKFCRFLIGLRKNTQHVTKDRFLFVPKLPMDESWDDRKLAELFDLDIEDQKFIETLIKPMD